MSRLIDPRTLSAGVLLAVLIAAVPTAQAAAQGSSTQGARMRVLVPSFEVPAGSRTGERLAEQVRRQISQMPTHAPVEPRSVRDALRRFNLREDAMACTQWVQLASHVDASLVLCGSVDESTQRVTARFMNLGGDAFEVPPFVMQSVEQGAAQVVQAFGTYVRQLALVTFCHDYLQSANWEAALENCDQALALNPSSVTAHYGRGSALSQMERWSEALAAFQKLLELDRINQDALLHAGILAAKLEQQDLSQSYFHEYLQLNPGNEQVRLSIATDLFNAGDASGALKLLEAVMDDASASGLLFEYAGHFAVNAGIKLSEAAAPGAVSEEANQFYRTAIRHYDTALAKRGDSIDAAVYRSLMLAHNRVGETQKALEYGQHATRTSPDDAQAWMIYAEVLGSAHRVDEAVRALDRVATIRPDMPNLYTRRAVLLLDAGRLNDAVAAIRTGVERGDLPQETAERLAQQMAVRGFQLTRDDRLDDAMPYLRAARQAGRAPATIAMADFFEAWNLIKQGAPTLQAANANAAGARRVKPLFERAKTLLEGARAYREQESQRLQLLQQVNQFIDVADALIKAGR